jgi:lysophospholipase L1-like esterase
VTRRFRPFLAVGIAVAFGCGQNPTVVSPLPTPTPTTGYTVTAVVFEDDNGNGVQDPGEPAIVPDVEIEVGGRTGTSQPGTGGVTITGVAAPGTYALNLRKLPPFYQPGAPQSVTIPQTGGPVLVPAVLPISANVHGLYLSEGDSISQGDPGSSDGEGYRSILEPKLHAAFLRGEIQYRGARGGRTDDGRKQIAKDLAQTTPAFVLIDYGVNDWNPIPGADYDQACQASPNPPDCPFIENLAAMVDAVRAADSLPVIATLTPPNTRIAPAERYQWVLSANSLIRTLARNRQALLVDVGDAFIQTGHPNDYFFDHIHPNDGGYTLMAETFFTALTEGTPGAQSRPPALLPLALADLR